MKLQRSGHAAISALHVSREMDGRRAGAGPPQFAGMRSGSRGFTVARPLIGAFLSAEALVIDVPLTVIVGPVSTSGR
jgi:hypothetical protein